MKAESRRSVESLGGSAHRLGGRRRGERLRTAPRGPSRSTWRCSKTEKDSTLTWALSARLSTNGLLPGRQPCQQEEAAHQNGAGSPTATVAPRQWHVGARLGRRAARGGAFALGVDGCSLVTCGAGLGGEDRAKVKDEIGISDRGVPCIGGVPDRFAVNPRSAGLAHRPHRPCPSQMAPGRSPVVWQEGPSWFAGGIG